MRAHPESGPPRRAKMILVSGGSQATPVAMERAESVGRFLAEAGAVVLTGGGSGVMEAASSGARAAGGTVVAVLPGADADSSPPNPHVTVAIFTGMQDARNAILVNTADAVIAIGGGWGTLSEIALAQKSGRPVILLGTWNVEPPEGSTLPLPIVAPDARAAVEAALRAAR